MNNHILITGASNGIGAALAKHYAAPGVMLSLCARNPARLEGVAQTCRDLGATVYTSLIDVSDHPAMTAWITAQDAQTPITTLIANAGVGDLNTSQLVADRTLFDINITGVLNSIDPIIPIMAQRGSGQIAMMASLAGYRGLSACPAYSASKGFVKLYGEGLRGALRPHGIDVSVICPGFVRSHITDQNTCPMPFFMEAETAAKIIATGLAKNKGRIAFPWPMALALWVLSCLPDRLAAWLTRRLPAKN